MGNSPTPAHSLPALRFVQTLDDPHFGEVNIFRTEEGRFLMRLTKTFIENDERQRQFQKVLEWSANAGEGTVAVLHVETTKEKGICIQYETSQLYTEYYNYTLLDLLASKKDVEEAELWCLLDALLRLTVSLDRSQLAIPLHLDNVFLTLKGRPIVYLYHLQSIEENIHYSMSQLAAKVVLQLANAAPLEQGREDDPMALLAPISKLCGRYKLLGRAVKELINGEKTDEQILQEMEQMIAMGKIKRANEIKPNKFKYLIPDSNSQSFEQSIKKDAKPFEFKPQRKNEESERKPKPSAEKMKQSEKKPMVEASNSKTNEMVVSKQDASKMLVELQKRKEENRLQMARFQLRKEELLNHSEKENRQNTDNQPRMTDLLRQSDKRTPSTTAPPRKPIDNSRHSRRR